MLSCRIRAAVPSYFLRRPPRGGGLPPNSLPRHFLSRAAQRGRQTPSAGPTRDLAAVPCHFISCAARRGSSSPWQLPPSILSHFIRRPALPPCPGSQMEEGLDAHCFWSWSPPSMLQSWQYVTLRCGVFARCAGLWHQASLRMHAPAGMRKRPYRRASGAHAKSRLSGGELQDAECGSTPLTASGLVADALRRWLSCTSSSLVMPWSVLAVPGRPTALWW